MKPFAIRLGIPEILTYWQHLSIGAKEGTLASNERQLFQKWGASDGTPRDESCLSRPPYTRNPAALEFSRLISVAQGFLFPCFFN